MSLRDSPVSGALELGRVIPVSEWSPNMRGASEARDLVVPHLGAGKGLQRRWPLLAPPPS